LLVAPHVARAQAQELAPIFEDASPLLAHASPAGYLGVDVTDVDADKAQALKLKDVRGAVITLIDHDAPAGQIGLKVNDVVLAINGQNVDGAETVAPHAARIPPGRKVGLEISRDGNIQTVAVQLADRKALENDIWNRIGQRCRWHRSRSAARDGHTRRKWQRSCLERLPYVALYQHAQRGRHG
jgi:serine protease Do